MIKVPNSQREETAKMLETWYKLTRYDLNSGNTEQFSDGIDEILRWLGFDVKKTNRDGVVSGRVWITLKEATVSHHCPIPAFGSRSGGEYRLICVWSQPSEPSIDNILDWIKQHAEGRATIIFYFGRMTVQSRSKLAFDTKKEDDSRPFLFIDENQLLFLCSEQGRRLPILFDCAMPFTGINPYTPFVSGNVPPEMFFGRKKEATDLMDLDGSCIIYGGRQLGKTALLQYVEREFENQSNEHKAVFLDLQSIGIKKTKDRDQETETQSLEKLWPALGNLLREKGVIPPRKTSSSPRLLFERIKLWIDARPNRRVLLMLDESDDFLEIDSEQKQTFEYVWRLKGLMDVTNRRFKLILAGLHNVQRFSAIPNQPLAHAHMGDPISIGPLTLHIAQELILKPLRTLGYRFDDPILVATIIFYMNSYPNLIQLFCHKLIEHVRKQLIMSKNTPPYIISEKHINAVYQDQNFRDIIRARFNLTLDLDKRYRFIAYRIAYDIRSDSGERKNGFAVDWITNEAEKYWPEGFAKTRKKDDVRILLNEMVKLGILFEKKSGYELSSPNVLDLLGTEEQIYEQFLETTNSDPSPEFCPNSFRRPLNVENQIKPSPFTAAQEPDILKYENDIRLIFGSEGLGIKHVYEGVRAVVEDYVGSQDKESEIEEDLENDAEEHSERVHLLDDDVQSHKQLTQWLDKHIINTQEGYVVPIVPLERSGSEPKDLIAWIETAQNVIEKYGGQKRTIRILFIVSPEASQVWVKVKKNKQNELTNSGAMLLQLKRWNDVGLHNHLDNFDIPNTECQAILKATGGWPIFIENLVQYQNRGKNLVDEIREKISKTSQECDDDDRPRFLKKLGIQTNQAYLVWQTLCKWCFRDQSHKNKIEPIAFKDLLAVIEDEDELKAMKSEDIGQIIDYFNFLNLLESEDVDQICPEPVAAAMTLMS